VRHKNADSLALSRKGGRKRDMRTGDV
jgi:hypothetical protein